MNPPALSLRRDLVAYLLALLVAPSIAWAAVHAPPIIDGQELPRDLPAPLWIQTIGTDFGNNTDPDPDTANGSEIDAFFAIVHDGRLYLGISGNLETNFNKLDLFFDVTTNGQNRLRGDNPDVDYDGLNRMGDDGSSNGLTFDAGIAPDYFLTYTTGIGGVSGQPEHYASAAMLSTNGGGAGGYVGGGIKAEIGAIEGDGPRGGRIRIDSDNSNVLGVAELGQPFSGPPEMVNAGIEVVIDLYELGWDGVSAIHVVGFINGVGHDTVSNQVVGGLPAGTGNLGEPRSVDFSAIGGDQFVTVLLGRDVDLDGDTVPDATDTNPYIFNPEQAPGSEVTTLGFHQLTYLDSDESPLVYLSDVGALEITLPTRLETIWINVVADGVWAIQNEPVFPIEIDPYSHLEQVSRFNFALGVPPGTPAGSLDYQLTLTRSAFDVFPTGVPVQSAPVTEQEILVGGFEAGPIPFPYLRDGEDDAQQPSSTRHTRPNYKQADLRSSKHAKACSAGAVASSIKWLLDQYKIKHGKDGQPGTADDYDPSLDDLVDEFVDLMGIKPGRGTTHDAIVQAKKDFINKHGLPLTVESDKYQGGDAAIKDIYEQMKRGQDVELELVGAAKKDLLVGYHSVSLVGINKAKNKNGSDVYNVTVRDDSNQRKPRKPSENPDGRDRSSGVRSKPGYLPSLPRIGKSIAGWTAESPTEAQMGYASSFVAEEAGTTTNEALGSGGTADEQQSQIIAADGAHAAELTQQLITGLEGAGYLPGTPEYDTAKHASLTAEYLRRAAFDVYEYLDDPAAQNAALLEANFYAWNLVSELTAFTSLFPPDADRDDVPDSIDNCDQANPTQADCDSNGVGDVCELNALSDCDSNGRLDHCELAAGSALDCNLNAIPDTCDYPGDFDGDDDADQSDYPDFNGCITVPCVEPPCVPALYAEPCCALADTDDDGDVDLCDFAELQKLFGEVSSMYSIDWCRLQFPETVVAPPASVVIVYGRLYIAGLTDQTTGNDTDPNVVAEVGYGPDGSPPFAGWIWTPAVPNPAWDGGAWGEPNNDEYTADLVVPLLPGPYDYAYRFSGDGGLTWTYADLNTGLPGEDGSENGYQPENAGELTVAE